LQETCNEHCFSDDQKLLHDATCMKLNVFALHFMADSWNCITHTTTVNFIYRNVVLI